MVLFFTSNAHNPPVIIYMGKDKVESVYTRRTRDQNIHSFSLDEELIRYAWPQDVWFHVDKLSSAHVYLRMPEGMAWDNIPSAILTDCAQLVKANSIEGVPAPFDIILEERIPTLLTGNKKDNLTIVYTSGDNLKKTGDMAVGQVSFHSDKKVKRVHVEKRENAIVNSLNKTKVEKEVNHEQERVDRLKKENAIKRAAAAEKRKAELELAKQREAEKQARSYDALFNSADEEEDTAPRKTGRELEEDFM